MIKILNLTQHPATKEQKKEGVVDLEGKDLEMLKELITFDEMPDKKNLELASYGLINIAKKHGFNNVLIGGACYFMPILDKIMKDHNINAFYAYSKRNAIDKYVDGKIVTEYTFEHEGFLKV